MTQTAPGVDVYVHPTAIVDPGAQLGAGVWIGPYCTVGPNVQLHARVRLVSHVVVDGHTTLADDVEVFPQATIGLAPQDLKYDGRVTTLEVGPRTVIRESATLQPGSVGVGAGRTVVGADCLLMAYTHIAHDCHVGNHVIMANATQIAGCCTIEDHVTLGGVTTVHQFTRIGRLAMTGASARIQRDIPPFTLADGNPAGLVGLNTVGLRRAGLSAPTRAILKRAYQRIFRQGPFVEAIDSVEVELAEHPEAVELCRFLRNSQRGVTRHRR